MSMSESAQKALLIVFLAGVSIAGFSCQRIKKLISKPPPEGVVQESYTIRMHGYEQTVIVKASVETVSEILSDLNNVVLPGYRTKEMKKFLDEGEPLELGSSFPASINRMGVEIEGRIIVIRRNEESMYWVFDNPQFFAIQRWEFRPVKEGTRLTFRVEYEIPAQMEKFAELMGIIEGLQRDVDLMLAMIQARFDPSLDLEELAAMGMRGDHYETLYQAYDTRIWVDAPPEEVESWITNAENTALYLPELKMEKESFKQFQLAPPGTVIHSPGSLDLGVIKTKADFFSIKNKKGKELTLRLYYIYFSNVGLVESQTKPEAGGTAVNSKMVFEIPSSTSKTGLDVIMFATGIPKLLRERVLMIKRAVENVG